MTCRQAINRPLPVSNGIRMRDYANHKPDLHQGRNGADLRLQLQGDVPDHRWRRWAAALALFMSGIGFGWLLSIAS